MRPFQIACGYEDANDSNDLRLDPGMKAACDRLPATGDDLASQPTMCRLENDVITSGKAGGLNAREPLKAV
jgi:hypothetical protein